MHAIDALHRDLKLKQYKQYPYIDYSEEDLDRIKTLVNSIWYDLIHKNYKDIHFCQPLDCPMGISLGYFTTFLPVFITIEQPKLIRNIRV